MIVLLLGSYVGFVQLIEALPIHRFHPKRELQEKSLWDGAQIPFKDV